MHIRQKTEGIYTVVIENGEIAIEQHPELFEEVNNELPEFYQQMIYNPE